jgi:hypothetical protein
MADRLAAISDETFMDIATMDGGPEQNHKISCHTTG